MKLDTAYLCYACREIQDRAPGGVCSLCGSDNVHPLGWIGRRRAVRVAWLARIGVIRKRRGNHETAN